MKGWSTNAHALVVFLCEVCSMALQVEINRLGKFHGVSPVFGFYEQYAHNYVYTHDVNGLAGGNIGQE
nr:hypothetical protein [uncultured Desulfobulbus sp.]